MPTDSTGLEARLQQADSQLARHGQRHLLRFADRLDDRRLAQLLDDIDGLDLDLIDQLIPRYVRSYATPKLPNEILPPPVYPITPAGPLVEKYDRARRLGCDLLAQGKVAAFVVAGGMGTRLGFDGPKGCFPATPIRKKVLFQVFAETILAAQRRYGGVIPWYVMTSPANHQQTLLAFRDHDHFGLDAQNVYLFPQGTMACFDFDGRILLAEPHRLATSPDGHGGSLRALYQSRALADMARRGIEHLSYFQVDNPLVRLIDPLFLGLHALDRAGMSSKAVIKREPLEKVGNFALINRRVHVIEYSDLPDELAHRRRPDGRLVFELGSIAIHVISRRFVEQLNEKGFSLPWHRAVKKVLHVDEQGNPVNPNQPNAVKLETFVFDALPLTETSAILAIDRDEEFAPIKNASGPDSVEASHQLQTARAARWLEKARVPVPRHPDGSVDAVLEIAPAFALDAEELAGKAARLPALRPGQRLCLE